MNNNQETLAYVCNHVFSKEKPVLYVVKIDGDWQLLCGGFHHDNDLPKIVGIEHFLDEDPTLKELLDLPDNWEAERKSPDAPWIKNPCHISKQ